MAYAGFGSSWGELTSETLMRILGDSVQSPRDEIGMALGVVVTEVNRILKEVTKADSRFGYDFPSSGCYIAGLNVSEPDEFDILVPLMKTPELSAFDGYVTDELPDASFVPVMLSNKAKKEGIELGADLSLWQNLDVSIYSAINYPFVKYLFNFFRYPSVKCLCNVWAPPGSDSAEPINASAEPINASAEPIKWRMSPEKIMGIYKKHVRDVINRSPGLVTVQRMSQGTPAVTFKSPYKGKEISVDLVPFIYNPCKEWSLDWPRPGARWPSQSIIDEIKATGVDLVAKHPLFWRYSFSRIERVLLENIDEDGGERRNSFRILKKVRLDRWKPMFGKNALVSYHLKNVLFWACEKYPNRDQWQDLAESFKRLVDMLIDFLSQGNLPLFFLSDGVNLFKAEKKVLKDVLQEVLRFRASPMAYFK